MPWGDTVVGIVLEDLSEIAEPFAKFCDREKDGILFDLDSAYDTVRPRHVLDFLLHLYEC